MCPASGLCEHGFPFQCEAPNLIDRLTISASDKISGRLATTEIVTTESGQRAVRVKVRRSDLGTEVLSGELRLIERVTKAEAVLSLLVSREQEIEVLPALTDFSDDNERCVAHHVIRVPVWWMSKGLSPLIATSKTKLSPQR